MRRYSALLRFMWALALSCAPWLAAGPFSVPILFCTVFVFAFAAKLAHLRSSECVVPLRSPCRPLCACVCIGTADLTTLILRKGLKRAAPNGLFKKLGSFFSSDKEHQVDHCVNLSGKDLFFGLPLSGTLAHVRACPLTSRLCCRLVAVSSTLSFVGEVRFVNRVTDAPVMPLCPGCSRDDQPWRAPCGCHRHRVV